MVGSQFAVSALPLTPEVQTALTTFMGSCPSPDEQVNRTLEVRGLKYRAMLRQDKHEDSLDRRGSSTLREWLLVPVADLTPVQLVSYRNFVDAERPELERDLQPFALIAFGVPALVGFVGFLAFRLGRWVWAGFMRAS